MKKLGILLFTLVLFIACIKDAADGGDGDTKDARLTNKWELAELNGKAYDKAKYEDQVPYIVFVKVQHSITGSNGCNNFTGRFLVDEDKLTFKGLANSLKKCGNKLSDLESNFNKNLQRTTKHSIEGDRLTLFHKKKPIMSFVKVEPQESPSGY